MTYFTILHWLFAAFMGLMLLVGLFFSLRKLRGQMLLMAVVVLFLATGFITFLGMVSLDTATKKAEIIKLTNKRILRTESIEFEGYVVNTGSYTIGESVFEIKIIDHGNATGRVKAGDFYAPRSLWERIFGSNKLGRKGERPNVIERQFLVATMLQPGERRRFKVRFRYPPYFEQVAFRTKLINH